MWIRALLDLKACESANSPKTTSFVGVCLCVIVLTYYKHAESRFQKVILRIK